MDARASLPPGSVAIEGHGVGLVVTWADGRATTAPAGWLADNADGGFEGLAPDNDFLMHGTPGRRLSVFLHRFLVATNAILLYLAGRDLGQAHVAEEG